MVVDKMVALPPKSHSGHICPVFHLGAQGMGLSLLTAPFLSGAGANHCRGWQDRHRGWNNGR